MCSHDEDDNDVGADNMACSTINSDDGDKVPERIMATLWHLVLGESMNLKPADLWVIEPKISRNCPWMVLLPHPVQFFLVSLSTFWPSMDKNLFIGGLPVSMVETQKHITMMQALVQDVLWNPVQCPIDPGTVSITNRIYK